MLLASRFLVPSQAVTTPRRLQDDCCFSAVFFPGGVASEELFCLNCSTGAVSAVGRLSVDFSTSVDGCVTENVTVTRQGSSLVVEKHQACASSETGGDTLPLLIATVWSVSPDNGSVMADTTLSSTAKTFWTRPVVFGYSVHLPEKVWMAGTSADNEVNETNSPINPLEPSSLAETYWYGDNTLRVPAKEHEDSQRLDSKPHLGHAPSEPAISLPMATVMNDNGSVSFLHDPDTDVSTVAPTANVRTSSSTGHEVSLDWIVSFWRFGNGTRPLHQRRYVHFDSTGRWRTAVLWAMETLEKSLTLSANVSMYDLNGAYASYHAFTWNATMAQKLGVTLNWDATFPYPYHGLWLPYNVTDPSDQYHGGVWTTCMPHQNSAHPTGCWQASFEEWNSVYQNRLSGGVSTCVYGNFFEFGWNMTHTNQPLYCDNVTDANEQLYCESSKYARGPLREAIARPWSFEKGVDPDAVYYSGVGMSIVLDAGQEVYKNHLVHMAELVAENVPDAVGVCFDGTGFIGLANIEHDDGITFVNRGKDPAAGLVARAQASSFHIASSAVAEALHKSGKSLFWNPYYPRLDFGIHVDGYFSEWGEKQPALMANALLAMAKPLITWNPACYQNPVRSPPLCPPNRKWDFNPSHVLSRLLYWGSTTMPPIVGNDHAATPSKDDQVDIFLHFKPLFELLRSKRWAFDYDVTLISGSGQANVFHTAHGLAVVVVFGQPGSKVTLQVAHFQKGSLGNEQVLEVTELRGRLDQSRLTAHDGSFQLALGPYGEGASIFPLVHFKQPE